MKKEPLLRLQEKPSRMSLQQILQYISVEFKLKKTNEAGLKERCDWRHNYKYMMIDVIKIDDIKKPVVTANG